MNHTSEEEERQFERMIYRGAKSEEEERQFERMICRIAKVIFWLIICAAIVSFLVTV